MEGPKRGKRQEGPTRREALGMAAGVAVGAAAGGVFEAIRDPEWENLKTAEEKIDYLRKKSGGFDNDRRFHDNSKIPTVGREQYSRAEYVQFAFNELEAINMSPEIQSRLATVAPGITAHESRYDNNKVSKDNAKYIWQMREIAIKELNRVMHTKLKLEDTKSLRTGTKAAFDYFDKIIYPNIAPVARECAHHFGLYGTGEEENFITLCLVNAYNTGPKGMADVITEFTSRFDSDDIHEAYEHTAMSLFNALAERGERDELRSSYKEYAAQYVFGTMAGAESLNKEYMLENNMTFTDRYLALGQDALATTTERVVEPMREGIIGGAIGGVIGAKIGVRTTEGGERQSGRRGIPTSRVKGDAISRRRLLAGGVTAAGLGVAGSYVAKEGLPSIDLSGLWWRGDSVPEEKDLTEFPDGTIYDPEGVANELQRFYSEGGAKIFAETEYGKTKAILSEQHKRLKTHRRNFTREGVPKYIKLLHKAGKVSLIETVDDMKDLNGIEEVNGSWRCRGIGMGNSSSPRNDERYLKLVESTKQVFESIMQDFQQEIEDAGLSDTWRARPIITSLARPAKLNEGVSGTSGNSPHMFGMAFDISDIRFDLIHKDTNTFTMMNRHNVKQNESSIINTFTHLILKVLFKAHKEGRITLTHESRAVHYHITDRTVG